jgi:hypothetical protein
LMGLVVIHLKGLPLGPAILLGALVYLTALICMGTFSPTEIRAARDLITKRVVEVLLQRGKHPQVGILQEPGDCWDETSCGPRT